MGLHNWAHHVYIHVNYTTCCATEHKSDLQLIDVSKIVVHTPS